MQWMGLHFVDKALLRSLVATAADVFAHVALYQPQPGAVLIVGSAQSLDVTGSDALSSARRQWRELGVLCSEDLFAARVLDNVGARRFAQGAALITDSRNLLRMRAPEAMHRPASAIAPELLMAPFEPPSTTDQDVDRLYLLRRFIRQRTVHRARRLAEAMTDPVEQQTAIALIELATGHRQRAQKAIRRALQLDPNHAEAQTVLLQMSRPRLSSGPLVASLAQFAAEPMVIAEGWRLSGAGDWWGTRRLEDHLAGMNPRHPLFSAATRLRVGWRIASGDAVLAREALDLLLPLLAPAPQAQDLLLLAQAGAASEEPRIALAAISEMLTHRGQRSMPQTAPVAQAHQLLRLLPQKAEDEVWRTELLQQTRAVSQR